MSKIGDMFSKIMNLDPNKEYDFVITDKSEPSPTPPTPPEPAPAPEPSPTPAPKPETPPAPAVDIASLQAQVQNLQAANLALLNRLPIQDNEKSVEEMIFDLCVGTKKGENNGVH